MESENFARINLVNVLWGRILVFDKRVIHWTVQLFFLVF